MAEVCLAVGVALAEVHASGAVVGDFNDQNELFAPDRSVHFIDADSFQLPGFPCEVATESFLDPLLYGPDPRAPWLTGSGARRFTPESDWYSFAVLAFRSITGVHPYGGVRSELPTFAERARAGASVFDEAVALPAASREGVSLLTNDLAGVFRAIFERRARGVFPLGLLASYADEIVKCSCGLELPASKLPCPRCQPVRVSRPEPKGPRALTASVLLEARGPIVALVAEGDTIRVVALEDRRPVLYTLVRGRSTRTILTDRTSSSGWEVSLAPTCVAMVPIGQSEGLFVWLGSGSESSMVPFVTERALGGASFAVTRRGLHRIARGTLLQARLDGEALSETPVTSVMSEQTRLFGSAEACMASERILSVRRALAIVGGRRIDLDLDPLEPGEALVEESLVAGPTSFAVLRITSLRGQRLFRAATFDKSGTARARTLESVDARVAEDAISGGLLQGDTLLVACERGLYREALGASASSTLFAEAAPFVGRDALLATSDEGLLAAHLGRLTRLRLEK